MPIVQVKKDTGKIASYSMDNLRIVDAVRALGTKTNEVGHTVTISNHYVLKERALKELVPNELKDQADKPITPMIDATENVTEKLWIIKEKALADVLSSTATITQNTTLSGTDQWNDYANSDPFDDIKTGRNTIRSSTGKKPNTLILSWDVWNTLLDHPDIVDRIADSRDRTADAANSILARAFNVKKVLVGDAQVNSTEEGETGSLSDIWSRVAILAYIEPRPTLKSRSLGFTYQMGTPRQVDTWVNIDRKGTYVRATDKYDQQLVDVNCAYLIKNAIAA